MRAVRREAGQQQGSNLAAAGGLCTGSAAASSSSVSEKMSVRAAIILYLTARGPLSLVAGGSLPLWPDSSVGVHEFLTMDIAYKGKAADINEAASRFDFIWGSSLGPAWRNVSTEIVTSLYTPYAWGSNITWWQINHPDWLLYKCDRVTPAYWNGIKADVPFDMSNEDAVRFRYHQIGGPGYNAIAADMFYLENTAGACGAWRAPTSVRPGESTAPQWVQLFSGKSSGDPKWEDAQIRWAQQCRALLHAHDPPLLLIPNYSLLGRSWDDPLLQRLLGSVDGILDEQGYSNYGGMDSGKSYFANLLKHQTNAQKKGCAYYQINEVHNTNSNATRRFVVGAYLQGRDNASAVFMSGVQAYGEEVPHRAEFDAPVGRALGPTIETNGTAGAAPNSGCWVREFSHAVVAVNANKLNTSACLLLLDPRRFSYQDVYGRAVGGAQVTVAANDAAILLRENRTVGTTIHVDEMASTELSAQTTRVKTDDDEQLHDNDNVPPSLACTTGLDAYCGNRSDPALAPCYAFMQASHRQTPMVAAFSGDIKHNERIWRCYSPSDLKDWTPETPLMQRHFVNDNNTCTAPRCCCTAPSLRKVLGRCDPAWRPPPPAPADKNDSGVLLFGPGTSGANWTH